MNKTKIVVVLFGFLFSLIALAQNSEPSFENESSVSQAEQPEPENTNSTPASGDSGSQNNSAPPPPVADSGDFEVFDPTEDISEDLSVPFPVDI